jgi:WD40 repeat protein
MRTHAAAIALTFIASVAVAQEGAIWRGHTAGVTSLTQTPDGKSILSSSLDGSVRVWDQQGKSHVLVQRDHELFAVAVSPDGKQAATCGYATTIDVIDAQSGTKVWTSSIPSGWCLALAFSPDGGTLAAGASPDAYLFDASNGKLLRTIKNKWSTNTVAWTPDGRAVALGSFDVTLINPGDGTTVRTIKGDHESIRALAFSRDGTLIAEGGFGAAIHVVNASNGAAIKDLEPRDLIVFLDGKRLSEPEPMPQLAAAFSPDGKRLVIAGSDRGVRIYDTATWKEEHVFVGHTKSVTDVVFLRDGRQVVSGSLDQTLRMWTLP